MQIWFQQNNNTNICNCLIHSSIGSLPIHKKTKYLCKASVQVGFTLQALGKGKIICGRRGSWESDDSSLKASDSDLSNTHWDRPTQLICLLLFNLFLYSRL